MTEQVYNTVGIRFKPEDDKIGIPVHMLAIIENKTTGEELDNEEVASIIEANNFDTKDIAGISSAWMDRLQQKNGCMIEYKFSYRNGWYLLEKYNCVRDQQEIEYLKEVVKTACSPIVLTIQEIRG